MVDAEPFDEAFFHSINVEFKGTVFVFLAKTVPLPCIFLGFMFIEEGERDRSSGRRYFALPVCKGNAFFIKNFSNRLTFLVKTAIIYEKSTFC